MGITLEDRFGHLRYLIFYLLCGVVATFAQLAFSMGSNIPNLGASGAIAGVLGRTLCCSRDDGSRSMLGYILVPIPALAVIGFWIVLQFFNGIGAIVASADTGGVAYMASRSEDSFTRLVMAMIRGKRVA